MEIRGAPREAAGTKNSAWIRDREPLEQLMRAADVGSGGINELLLSSQSQASESPGQHETESGNAHNTGAAHTIFEGSQTNFFAIVGGALHTAPNGTVLEGTVRRLALEVCERENIEVVMEAPTLLCGGEGNDNPQSWDGALISSTSRLMLPIDEIYVPSAGAPSTAEDLKVKFNNQDPQALAPRLAKWVEEAVVAHSEPICSPHPNDNDIDNDNDNGTRSEEPR